jgi:hypothetical protein
MKADIYRVTNTQTWSLIESTVHSVVWDCTAYAWVDSSAHHQIYRALNSAVKGSIRTSVLAKIFDHSHFTIKDLDK